MLHACAVIFTEFLYRRCSLSDGYRDVYIYGSELFFSTSLSAISILLISILMGRPISGILFILIFAGLRIFVGGFHAATYKRCFLLTNGVFLITLGGSISLRNCNTLTSAMILISSVCVIWTLAPIRNNHHPLSEKTYQKNKKIGRVLVIAEGMASIFTLLIGTNLAVLSISMASITAVAMMMVAAKLVEGRGHYD